MARAIVCLPSQSQAVIAAIRSTLADMNVKVFNSVDDGFEYIWNDGRDAGLFILDLDDRHVDELWECARNWPSLHFIALHDDDERLPEPTLNMVLFALHGDTASSLTEVQDLIEPYVSRLNGG